MAEKVKMLGHFICFNKKEVLHEKNYLFWFGIVSVH
jgi:hypothetical protein